MLTEPFEEAKNAETPVMVHRIVDNIDEIVRAVRFDGWQATHAGEREVKKVLRQTLFKYKLHQATELFERAYGYMGILLMSGVSISIQMAQSKLANELG